MGTLRKQHNEKFIQQLIKEKPKSYNKPEFIKKVMELINTGALQRENVKDLVRVKYGLPTLESSDIQQIVEKMKQYDSLPAGDEKENAYKDALKVIADKLPVTSMEKVIAFRRMAMLFNSRTWMRNIGGNAILNIVSKGSDSLAQLIELGLPIEERTKAMGTYQQYKIPESVLNKLPLKVREKLDSTFFLIPGYGAQGGTAEDVALYMKNGNGGVVNSSRGILLAYKNHESRENDFELCAREEVLRIREELNKALGGKENEHKLWTAYSA
jgi:hypothetical protein